MIIGITGHRPDKIGGYSLPNATYIGVCKALHTIFSMLSPSKIITGMALGTDQYAAIVANRSGIPFTAAVPFEGQECKWNKKSQNTYKKLISMASEKIVVSSGSYSAAKLSIRNEFIVNNCDVLVACFDGSPGGTQNCIRYADKIGRVKLVVDPQNINEAKLSNDILLIKTILVK